MKDISHLSGSAVVPRHLPVTRHVLIIGGGASGVLLAAHLLTRPDSAVRVTLIEGRYGPGCGVAYSTQDPDHLLNTRVHSMSAFADDPKHFERWLAGRPEGVGTTGNCFVRRTIYGAYLSDLLAPWQDDPARLSWVAGHCVQLDDTAEGVVAYLEDGRALAADVAVLATGHVRSAPEGQGGIVGAWDPIGTPDPEARVVIVGSGLSMVDRVLSLLNSGHRGPIVALSRRGQMPRTHQVSHPMPVAAAAVPFGAPLSRLMRWVRALARQAESQGGTWRDAVDGLRPHVRAIWCALPMAERSRFLRHAATWWDVHRHRIPPDSEARIRAALASGQLVLQRGAFLGAVRTTTGELAAHATLGGEEVVLPAARIIDCRGIRRDPLLNASPLVAYLLAQGRARVDPLRIGLDVAQDCRLLDARGQPIPCIRVIGPASRAAFWEITAIPDIREQAARIAEEIAVA